MTVVMMMTIMVVMKMTIMSMMTMSMILSMIVMVIMKVMMEELAMMVVKVSYQCFFGLDTPPIAYHIIGYLHRMS